MLTLSNFENEIDPTIVDRGVEYYESGAVIDVEGDNDSWMATVIGTESYLVEVTLIGDTIAESFCDCPYDWGPHCKHEVALWCAIREAKKQRSKKQGKAPTSKRAKLADILGSLDKDELLKIIMEQVKHNPNLSNQLLMKYDPEPADESLYADMIRRWAREESDRGYLDYRASRIVGKNAQNLVNKAREMFLDEDLDRALPVLRTVIKTVHEIMVGADDSSGDLGGALEYAFNTLDEAALLIKEQERDAELFAYYLDGAMNPDYRYVDYDWRFLWLAGNLVDSEARRDQLFALLDDKVDTSSGRTFSRYRAEDAVRIKQQVMEKLGTSAAEIDQLLQDNVHLHRIRKMLIDKHIKKKAYAEASKLISDGYVQAERENLRGLIRDYQEMMLDIAVKTGDHSATRELTERLFFEGREQIKYLGKLKSYVSEGEWPQYRKQLLERLVTEYRYGASLLPRIYEYEDMWDEMYALVKKQRDIRLIVKYHDEFAKRFPVQLAEMYEQHIYKIMEHGKNRSVYRECVDYLRRIMQVDSEERAFNIADDLKTMYPTRRAMIDELSKL